MKKYGNMFRSLITLALFFISCSDDDDGCDSITIDIVNLSSESLTLVILEGNNDVLVGDCETLSPNESCTVTLPNGAFDIRIDGNESIDLDFSENSFPDACKQQTITVE